MVGHHAPILLFGFDFPTQQRQLSFDHVWAAAFLTPRYTDEDNETLHTSCYRTDPEKKREVKYGNNVAVLFRALVYLGERSGQPTDGFWPAIARGFNTNAPALVETVSILVEARRKRRPAPSREVSETARAADRWIDFIDQCSINPVQHLSPMHQIKIAQEFLTNSERTMINAAGVPLNPAVRPIASVNGPGATWRAPPSGRREMSPPYRRPSGPTIKTETPISPQDINRDLLPYEPRTDRKRSASPISPGRSPEPKRLHHDAGDRRSPKHTFSPPPPHTTTSNDAPSSKVLASPLSSEIQQSTNIDEISDPSRQLLDENGAMLKSRVEELRLHLAKTDGQIEALATIDRLGNGVGGVRDEMNGMKSAMEVIMDSMHTIVDNLNIMKDDISVLKTQRPAANSELTASGVSALLQPIQTLSDNLKFLKDEVTDLKIQVQHPVSSTVQPDSELRSLIIDQNSLILEQNRRINQLTVDMTRMQSLVGSMGPKPAPQNLRQAVAAAEHDIRHHMQTVTTFYHRLNSTASNRAAAEKTADLLLALEEGLRCAQNGLQG